LSNTKSRQWPQRGLSSASPSTASATSRPADVAPHSAEKKSKTRETAGSSLRDPRDHSRFGDCDPPLARGHHFFPSRSFTTEVMLTESPLDPRSTSNCEV
jgi:hypothetical protein